MKTKNTFLLLFTILLTSCLAKEHFEFMDVSIDGNVDKFTYELIKLGFTDPQLTEENQINLNGVFLEKNCEIYVYGTKKSKTVYKVRVNLPKEVPDSLENSFEKLKKMCSSKHGVGRNKYKQFQNSERFLFNEPKRTRQLNFGDQTKYSTYSGEITLEVRSGYISITYLDNQNNEIRKKELEGENIEEIWQ